MKVTKVPPAFGVFNGAHRLLVPGSGTDEPGTILPREVLKGVGLGEVSRQVDNAFSPMGLHHTEANGLTLDNDGLITRAELERVAPEAVNSPAALEALRTLMNEAEPRQVDAGVLRYPIRRYVEQLPPPSSKAIREAFVHQRIPAMSITVSASGHSPLYENDVVGLKDKQAQARLRESGFAVVDGAFLHAVEVGMTLLENLARLDTPDAGFRRVKDYFTPSVAKIEALLGDPELSQKSERVHKAWREVDSQHAPKTLNAHSALRALEAMIKAMSVSIRETEAKDPPENQVRLLSGPVKLTLHNDARPLYEDTPGMGHVRNLNSTLDAEIPPGKILQLVSDAERELVGRSLDYLTLKGPETVQDIVFEDVLKRRPVTLRAIVFDEKTRQVETNVAFRINPVRVERPIELRVVDPD